MAKTIHTLNQVLSNIVATGKIFKFQRLLRRQTVAANWILQRTKHGLAFHANNLLKIGVNITSKEIVAFETDTLNN